MDCFIYSGPRLNESKEAYASRYRLQFLISDIIGNLPELDLEWEGMALRPAVFVSAQAPAFLVEWSGDIIFLAPFRVPPK